MSPVRAAVEVEASASDVWPYVAEFRHWPTWGPTVTAVDSAADSVAAGVTGRVRTIAGVWLPFVITSAEPEQSWDWKVAGIAATGHRLVPLGPTRTRVEFTAPALAAPYVVVLRAGLRRLKHLVEGSRPA